MLLASAVVEGGSLWAIGVHITSAALLAPRTHLSHSMQHTVLLRLPLCVASHLVKQLQQGSPLLACQRPPAAARHRAPSLQAPHSTGDLLWRGRGLCADAGCVLNDACGPTMPCMPPSQQQVAAGGGGLEQLL